MIGSKTCCEYQNLWVLKSHSWPSISAVPQPQIQLTMDYVILYVFTGKKKIHVSVDLCGSNPCWSRITESTVFCIYLCIYLYEQVLYFHMVLYCCFASFCFNLKTSFSVSYKSSLVAINSLSFCLSKKVFISSFLKNSFAQYSILGWQVLFFLSAL